MIHDVIIRVKELGEIKAEFIKSTKDHIYLKNAAFCKAMNTTIEILKINKKFIVSFSRFSTPNFELFRKEELEKVLKFGTPQYSEIASSLLKNGNYLKDVKKNDSQVQKIVQGLENMTKTNEDSAFTGKPSLKKDKITEKKAATLKKIKKSPDWNQIEANKEQFGVDEKFDISEYTDPINKNAKNYDDLFQKSVQIADELNAHLKNDEICFEERAFIKDSENISEEKLFSTVDKSKSWSNIPLSHNSTAEKISSQNSLLKVPSIDEKTKILIEQEKKAKQSIGGDGANMWMHVSSFLVAKKQIQGETTQTAPEDKKCESPLPESVSKNSHLESTNSSSAPEKSAKELQETSFEEKRTFSKPYSNRSFDKDKRNIKEFSYNKQFKNKTTNRLNGEYNNERRQTKNIVLGFNPRFNNMQDLLENFHMKFLNNKTKEISSNWGKGEKLSEKINKIKSEYTLNCPSDQRIKDIKGRSTTWSIFMK